VPGQPRSEIRVTGVDGLAVSPGLAEPAVDLGALDRRGGEDKVHRWRLDGVRGPARAPLTGTGGNGSSPVLRRLVRVARHFLRPHRR
jgi:hypothetical protein